MSTVTTRSRVAKGVSTGGQFATESKAEATVSLSTPAEHGNPLAGTVYRMPIFSEHQGATLWLELGPEKAAAIVQKLEEIEAGSSGGTEHGDQHLLDAVESVGIDLAEAGYVEGALSMGEDNEALTRAWLSANRDYDPSTASSPAVSNTDTSINELTSALDGLDWQRRRTAGLEQSVQFALAHQSMVREDPEAIGIAFTQDRRAGRVDLAGFVRADGTVVERDKHHVFLTPCGDPDFSTSSIVEQLVKAQAGLYRQATTADGVSYLALPSPVRRADCQDLASSIEADYEDDWELTRTLNKNGILSIDVDSDGQVKEALIHTDCYGHPFAGKPDAAQAAAVAQQALDEMPHNTRTGIRWSPDTDEDLSHFKPHLHP